MEAYKKESVLPAGRLPAFLASLLLLVVLLLSSVGCGGSGSRSEATGGAPAGISPLSRRQGSLRLNIAWPEVVPGSSRLIPAATSTIVLEVTAPEYPGEGVLRRQVITRPAGGGVQTITLNRLPEVTLRVAAYTAPQPDGSGTPLSAGVGEAALTPAEPTKSVTISLASTIASATVTPATLTLGREGARTLEVQAKDSAGNIVVTLPGTWEWIGEGPITVQPSGLSATISATGPGQATLRVRETESGIVATVPVQIQIEDGGDITGVVTSAETGLPVEGVRVETAGLNGVWETRTDGQGRYRLVSVPSGNRVVSFAFCGLRTEFEITVATGGEVALNAALETAQTEFEAPPAITLNQPEVNQASGIAVITGSIARVDAGEAVLLVNGSESLITVESGGSFRHVVILLPGTNRIQLRATNCKGTVLSLVREVQLTANYHFRVTLEWDGSGDVDLYTWAPNGQLSYFGNKTIATGALDVDNVVANGPENFTNQVPTPGRYAIGVNAYSQAAGRSATIRVTVLSGPNSGQVFSYGPYRFTANSSGSGPVGNTSSWWRPLDVVIDADGAIFVDEPTAQVNRSRSQIVPKQ